MWREKLVYLQYAPKDAVITCRVWSLLCLSALHSGCFCTDRQDLKEAEKVDILQEPLLEALKV